MMPRTNDFSRLFRFGQLLVLLNIIYCAVMMFYLALSRGDYIFTSKYFYAVALMTLLYCKLDSYLRELKLKT
ncbi:hypothetical protein GCM10011338_07270 [Alteromonas lipolytica]|uniref:Uncharacterized protein n=1 Tax=Alteromonas lipolytica TaxID=1856405 RepID=A0A1E8FH02_9ALTE|nr:hypothetical protein BFC17_16810 [Alteromonas lipolytica]GGF57571.1 hypothetical protein GCM10011338_07270 [Alteromonas lipolytica]